jgi:hypothetical protein
VTLRAYVCGAWIEQHQRVRPMIARLRVAGIEPTHDWTVAEGDVCSCGYTRAEHGVGFLVRRDATGVGIACSEFNGVGVGGDSKLSAEDRCKYALADLRGVLTADVVWLLVANTQQACGSWVELGAALACRALRESEVSDPYPAGKGYPWIVVSGPKWQRTIFTEPADAHFDTDEEAFRAILSRRGR